MNARFHFDRSFDVADAVSLKEEVAHLSTDIPVVLDFRDVQYVTQTAVEALAAAIRSLHGHRLIGLGFEGLGVREFRALGVRC